jgi:hypothetical protein
LPVFPQDFDEAERAIERIYARGNDDPQSIELFDSIVAAVRTDGNLKSRIDNLLRTLIAIRTAADFVSAVTARQCWGSVCWRRLFVARSWRALWLGDVL